MFGSSLNEPRQRRLREFPTSRIARRERALLGCGLCCDGTFLDRVPVSAEEEVQLDALGFSFVEIKGDRVFKLPCHKESCGSCTIYEARPRICREFRCGLLKGYQSGELSLEEARTKPDKVRQLLAAVIADDPAAARCGIRREIRNHLAERMQKGDRETRRALAQQFLNILALDSYLERWFRNGPSRPKAQTSE